MQKGHLQQQSIVNIRPGPTAFETNHIIKGRPSSFQIIFSETMLQNIQKCTISEAQCVTGNIKWNVTLQELPKFISLIITRDVLGQRGMPCSSLWNKSWGAQCSVKLFPGTGLWKYEISMI